MSTIDIETEEIYLIQPLKVINDDTKNIRNKRLVHNVTFEKNLSNISAAKFEGATLKDLFSERIYYPNIGYCCEEGTYYVREKDMLKLIEYRYRDYIWSFMLPFTHDIERLMLELKPRYSIDEIKKYLEQYKLEIINNSKNEVKQFIYKKIIRQPVSSKNHYTTSC